jgi:16S rRNA (cytosine1402-N4)-methyltransferase
MNRNAPLNAEQVINTYDHKALAKMFSLYGELTNANRIAKTIATYRSQEPITTVEQLAELVSPMFPSQQQNKMLAKVFQAIRIEVNREMETLRQMLLQVEQTLTTEGRLVVIAYHSLEDRLVKNFIRSGNFDGELVKDFYGNVFSSFEQINRKVIVPSDEELTRNPRSRSAKLRIARKK